MSNLTGLRRWLRPRLVSKRNIATTSYGRRIAKGITTNNYDGGKGLELIPFEKVEVIFNVPPYLAHNDPKVRDGFGDVAFLVKYRLLSANEEHGNYILTAFLGWSLPTGDHKNGRPRGDYADDRVRKRARELRSTRHIRGRSSHC